jgi:putative membrane protein
MMKRVTLAVTVIAAAVGLAVAQTGNQQQPVQPGGGAAPPADRGGGMRMIPDPEFAILAASGGLLEVQSSQTAQQRATNDEVKKFAKQMVDDHTKANQELMQIVTRRGANQQPQMVTHHAVMAQRLGSMSGAMFDMEYACGQIGSHVEAVALFEAYSKNGQDQELRAFAAKHLPHLKQHLTMAQKMFRALPAPAGGEESQHKDHDK